jgi:hypothetical protein
MLYGRTTQAVPDIISRFCPFACWPPSQPSYAFPPHHGPPILRSHNTRGSRHRFQRLFLRFSAVLLTFLLLPPTSLLAVINAFLLHVTRGSQHRFHPRPFAFRQLDHHPAPSFTQAFILPCPSSALSPDMSLLLLFRLDCLFKASWDAPAPLTRGRRPAWAPADEALLVTTQTTGFSVGRAAGGLTTAPSCR